MQVRKITTDRSPIVLSIVIIAALLIGVVPHLFAANGELVDRYDKISSQIASAISSHAIGFTIGETAVPVGSISIEFCSNSPLSGDTCTAPVGFDVSGANLDSQTGETGFSILSQNANAIILQRPAILPTGIPSEYVFTNIINPSVTGSHYVRLGTYTSTDGTGPLVESGGLVFAIRSGLSVSTTVPPHLTFCAAAQLTVGDCSSANSQLVDLGEFSEVVPSTAYSEFMVATNAANGFSVFVTGTTLTSGNNIIPGLSGGGSIPGTSQFGMNLLQNFNPPIGTSPTAGTGVVVPGYGSQDIFKFNNGDMLVSSTTTTIHQKFRVSYLVNISSTQPAGYYSTTLTYICLANF